MRHRAPGWCPRCSGRIRWTSPSGSGPNRRRAEPAVAADGYGDFQTPPALAEAGGGGPRRARPGPSNFDLAECVWLKLITELAPQRPTIALLCKTRVARHVLTWCGRNGVPVARAALHLLDSRRWFGAAVDAGLFVLELGTGPP